MRLRDALAATFGLWLAVAASARAQEATTEIKPPFNLTWGLPSETIERLLKGAHVSITQRKKVAGGREAWEVDGLVPQSGVKKTVFYFRRGELIEVELQYQKDEWDDAKYNEYMGQLRRVLEKRYGVGQQIVRRTEPQGEVTEKLAGYKWNLNNTAVELFCYSAEDPPNVYRTLSVHYKGD
jgi:hypothetical protein